MDNLSYILDTIISELDSFDEVREKVISRSRELNRLSGRGIALLVMGETAEEIRIKAKSIYFDLKILVNEIIPINSWRSSSSGVEEYAEFAILNSILSDNGIPSPDELKLPSWIWLSALGDVTGELRRIILNKLLLDKYDEAFALLSVLQKIFREISGLSFSKSMIPNFRKKIDVARMTVERTESDILNFKLSRGE